MCVYITVILTIYIKLILKQHCCFKTANNLFINCIVN